MGRLLPFLASGVLGGRAVLLPPLLHLTSIDANNFQAAFVCSNGKTIAYHIGRGNGSNDAGAAHETFRLVRVFILDAVTDSYATGTGGWGTWAASNGSKDYARYNRTAAGFGGSVHGGETVSAQAITLDGVDITAAAAAGTLNATGRSLRITWDSTITWTTGGETATVTDFDMLIEGAVITKSMTHAGASNMGVSGTPKLDYLLADFGDSRFTEKIEDGVTTNMSGNTEYDIDLGLRSVRLRDPLKGDAIDFSYTISGSDPSRFHTWYNAGQYAKVYVTSVGGIVPATTVTCRTEYIPAAIPQFPSSLPFTDSFPGSALQSHWKLVSGSISAFNVSGGALALSFVDNAADDAIVMPLHLPPHDYAVEIDYTTGTAQSSGQAGITRADTVNATNPLVAMANFNATGGATMTINFTVAEGQTPWLRIAAPGFSGRSASLTEMRVRLQ